MYPYQISVAFVLVAMSVVLLALREAPKSTRRLPLTRTNPDHTHRPVWPEGDMTPQTPACRALSIAYLSVNQLIWRVLRRRVLIRNDFVLWS
jgi:hypothetical protein